MLYQDKFGNAVFLHKNEDGKIVGAELQGTNTYKRFKGVAEGTSFLILSARSGKTNSRFFVGGDE